MPLSESIVGEAALEWFRSRQGYAGHFGVPPTSMLRLAWLGYAVGHGAAFAGLQRAKPSLALGEPAAERDSFGKVVQFYVARTPIAAFSHGEKGGREVIRRLNPAIPSRTLAALRDTLLPKLLSGDLSFPDPLQPDSTL